MSASNNNANVIDLTSEEPASGAPAAAAAVPVKRPAPLRFVRARPAPAAQAQAVKMEVEEKSPPATQELEPFSSSSPDVEEEEEESPRAKKARHDDDFELDRTSGAAFKEIEVSAEVDCTPGVPRGHAGRAVGLIGNHNDLKAALVNAWVGLPVFSPSGYDVPSCNVTFVHNADFGSTPVACEQTSFFGTFVAKRFPDVDNLRGAHLPFPLWRVDLTKPP